jgi:hypothetical protein
LPKGSLTPFGFPNLARQPRAQRREPFLLQGQIATLRPGIVMIYFWQRRAGLNAVASHLSDGAPLLFTWVCASDA